MFYFGMQHVFCFIRGISLNPVIEEIERNCLSWSEDSSSLVFDQKPSIEGADVYKDQIYNALFAPQPEQLDQLHNLP